MRGYLVVLRRGFFLAPGNPMYRGMNRIPEYPSDIAEEETALDDYVFGEIRGDDGLIQSLSAAVVLEKRLSASSRKFEVIFCNQHTEKKGGDSGFLGYDVVANGGGFWSIARDASNELQQNRLNENGLFRDATSALKYCADYRSAKRPDYDLDFLVFEIYETGGESSVR